MNLHISRAVSVMVLAACVPAVSPASADPPDRPRNGLIEAQSEPVRPGLARPSFRVHLTGDKHRDLINASWPQDLPGYEGFNGEQRMGTQIPRRMNETGNEFATTVRDYRVEVIYTGTVCTLDVESVHTAAAGGYELWNVFGELADRLGEEVTLALPVIGGVEGGPRLYGLADLNTYMNAPPSFAIGTDIAVVNGLVAGWDGYMISSTPFAWTDAAGFSGDGYTGAARISGQTDMITPVPAPAGAAFIGVAAGLLARRRR